MKVAQINLQHSKAASAELVRRLSNGILDIVLIQEPHQIANKIVSIGSKNYDIIYNNDENKPRTCIIVKKNIKVFPLTTFCNGDDTVITVSFQEQGGNQTEIVMCSSYFPGDFNSPPSRNIENLVDYCKQKKKQLVIGCDCNAHHVNWGSTNTNVRGVDVMDFILRNELEVLNK